MIAHLGLPEVDLNQDETFIFLSQRPFGFITSPLRALRPSALRGAAQPGAEDGTESPCPAPGPPPRSFTAAVRSHGRAAPGEKGAARGARGAPVDRGQQLSGAPGAGSEVEELRVPRGALCLPAPCKLSLFNPRKRSIKEPKRIGMASKCADVGGVLLLPSVSRSALTDDDFGLSFKRSIKMADSRSTS